MARGATIAYELTDLIVPVRPGADSTSHLNWEEQRGIFNKG